MNAELDLIKEEVEEYAQQLPPIPAGLKIPGAGELAGWIDHTLLKPEATSDQLKKLCREANFYHFATVCVNPVNIPLVVDQLARSGVGACAVVGFPFGATFPEIKAAEARQAISAGATEIDMVVNIGALKSGNFDLVMRDVKAVVEAVAGKGLVKVILEMCYLDFREKIAACLICKHAGADFVKTSTGFGSGGATVEDVTLMRRLVGEKMGVKAAGGIRTLADSNKMILAGANRLGASAGISILQEAGYHE